MKHSALSAPLNLCYLKDITLQESQLIQKYWQLSNQPIGVEFEYNVKDLSVAFHEISGKGDFLRFVKQNSFASADDEYFICQECGERLPMHSRADVRLQFMGNKKKRCDTCITKNINANANLYLQELEDNINHNQTLVLEVDSIPNLSYIETIALITLQVNYNFDYVPAIELDSNQNILTSSPEFDQQILHSLIQKRAICDQRPRKSNKIDDYWHYFLKNKEKIDRELFDRFILILKLKYEVQQKNW